MTDQEYRKRSKELKKKHNEEWNSLMREYAISNNKVMIGDVVSDHLGKIRVESIGVFFDRNDPSCIYRGVALRKDGTPFKSGEKQNVYQKNSMFGE